MMNADLYLFLIHKIHMNFQYFKGYLDSCRILFIYERINNYKAHNGIEFSY